MMGEQVGDGCIPSHSFPIRLQRYKDFPNIDT